jgi:filamentous hemagglutinin
MESAGNFSIRADSIVNRRDQFKTVSEMYSADIGVRCYECTELPRYWTDVRDDGLPSHLVWEEKFRVTILERESSKAASITSGRDLDVSGGSFLNSNSSVAASGNISISVSNFENSGTATGDYVSRKYVTGGQTLDQWREIAQYNMYNDVDYNQDLRFWNVNEVESRTVPRQVKQGAKNEYDYYQDLGPIVLYLGSYTGNVLPAAKFGAAKKSSLLTHPDLHRQSSRPPATSPSMPSTRSPTVLSAPTVRASPVLRAMPAPGRPALAKPRSSTSTASFHRISPSNRSTR